MTCPNIKVKMVKMHDTKFYCCNEYKFCRENGFIMFDEGYSNHLIIKFYNPKESLPMNHYASVLTFCPFCGSKIR